MTSSLPNTPPNTLPCTTPFQTYGYVPEDTFTVYHHDYPHLLKNCVVTLDRDDGSSFPSFKGVNGQAITTSGEKIMFINLNSLKKTTTVAKPVIGVIGVKYDGDKPEFSLLPKGVLQPVLRVLGFGKKKYAADNWQRVDNARERYYNAMQRHITSWWEGEAADPETGENHLAHAACCILFLLWFDNQTTGKS